MRDRLVELIVNAENAIYQEKPYITDTERIGKVADNLLSEGVIVPPCKLGDTVYCIFEEDDGEKHIDEKFVTAILFRDIGLIIRCGFCFYKLCDIGKDLFFTREEAEKAIAERSEKDGKAKTI